MRFQDIVAGMFILILAYLVLANWNGANQLLSTSAGSVIGLTRTLQGRNLT